MSNSWSSGARLAADENLADHYFGLSASEPFVRLGRYFDTLWQALLFKRQTNLNRSGFREVAEPVDPAEYRENSSALSIEVLTCNAFGMVEAGILTQV